MAYKFIAISAAAALLLAAAPAFAQQGTTLAGPAQGSKANGASSTMPSGETGAGGGAMTKSGGSMTKSGGSMTKSGGAASGTGESKGTATGGNPGGNASKN